MNISERLRKGDLLPWTAVSFAGFTALWVLWMACVGVFAGVTGLPQWPVRLAGLGSLMLGLPATLVFAVSRAKSAKRERDNDLEDVDPAEDHIRALEEERDFYRALVENRNPHTEEMQVSKKGTARLD